VPKSIKYLQGIKGVLLQPQEGVLASPKKHSLIKIYNFNDLPLIAMNVARIGAQVPSMASEVGDDHHVRQSKNSTEREKVSAVIGFGPMMWILITPDAPVRGGFRAFDDTEINGIEVPETDGDMFLYFSSGKAELNQILAKNVEEKFGSNGKLIEEIALEGEDHSDIVKEKVLIHSSSNLDTMQSSFVFTQKFKANAKPSSDLPQYRFSYQTKSGSGMYTLTFSNQPNELEETSESINHPPISRGIFFLPSLDLLTSLRMGGIRMGSLAINAKWKE